MITEAPAPPRRTWGGETGQNQLYKPFLRAALIVVLTVGCTFGAINLAVMGFGADLHAVWWPLIQGHGYAQMFGWAGLFIMGVAYHTIPRFYLRPLRRPGLVRGAFGAAVAGIVLRFVSQPLLPAGWAAGLLVLSGLLGVAAMALFLWGMVDTLRHGADSFGPPAARAYLATGLAGLGLGALATLGLTVYLAAHGLAVIPPAWDAPYVRLVLSGAIVPFILGYSLRMVPHMLGLQPVARRPLYPLLAMYAGAVLLQVTADSGLPGPISATLGATGALGELAALGGFVIALRLYGRPAQPASRQGPNRWPARFIRTAYAWLLIAAGLNAAYALAAWTGNPVPHPFMASYHHALTVGFISLMIVGMSMRLVPVFIGAMNRQARMGGVIFALLLGGNTLRVLTESLAYLYGGPFYALMGLSGLVEVTALTLYAGLLWQAMRQPSYGQGTEPAAITFTTRRPA